MEDQIIELERKYWDGMANLDYETVKNLTYFPCIVASKDGVNQIDITVKNLNMHFEAWMGDSENDM